MATQSAPVLVTRPRAEAERFAADLAARFGERVCPVISPLLAPRFLAPIIPDRSYDAVVFTSAQAVLAARELHVALPERAWCVGHKTAQVAAGAGFQARSADGDAEALANAIASDLPNGRILYLRGVDTRGNLWEKLDSFGVDTDVAIVYEQVAQPLSAEAIGLLNSPGDLIVPLFSPRTALLFSAAVPSDFPARLHLAAMSDAVAQPLHDLHPATLAIARHPDAPAMLDAVESLLVGRTAP